MPMLLAAQQVSGSPEFQVQRGNFEACSEITELFQCRQPLPCHFTELCISRDQQIGVGATVRSADASA